MAIALLDQSYYFPPSQQANSDGLLAVGGDLHPKRLIKAYSKGIFRWFNEDEPPLWWTPDPRFVLFAKELKISKSMRTFLKKSQLRFEYNTHFKEIMIACQQQKRKGQSGTWITHEFIDSYVSLHHMGVAISAACFEKDLLIGGLYGVLLPKMFCGESMFAIKPNASKYAFIHLVNFLFQEKNIELIDCQIQSAHLESLGARSIPRKVFEQYL
ncbi:MAG: leucyl/phenylalanyl-tRNA--protein transferase [Chitinophagaceae bacterium]